MCTASRLERQFATLYLFHAPTPPSPKKLDKAKLDIFNNIVERATSSDSTPSKQSNAQKHKSKESKSREKGKG